MGINTFYGHTATICAWNNAWSYAMKQLFDTQDKIPNLLLCNIEKDTKHHHMPCFGYILHCMVLDIFQ
jgi:hypothetical protein